MATGIKRKQVSMKNKDLIKLLKKFDPEQPVCFEDGTWETVGVDSKRTTFRCRNCGRIHRVRHDVRSLA